MADSTIPGKPNRATLDGNELLPSSYNGSPFNISVNSIKNFVVGLFSNKATVLDELSVIDNKLAFKGTQVQQSATTASGASNEVQFRNTATGALDSDTLFKYDKGNGVLIAGKSFKDIESFKSVVAGFEAGKSLTLTATGNTHFGYAAGTSTVLGRTNTFIGYSAGINNVNGEDNVCLGARAGEGITGVSNTFLGTLAGYLYTAHNNVIAIGRAIDKSVKYSYDFILGVNQYLFLEGNMASGTRWFRVNAAQLIRSFEIDSIAPVVTGTVTAGTANTLTDSSKTYVLNQYANFVVEKTTVGGDKEQRVILSNTTAGQLTVRENWTVTPVAGDTFKIITATIITADNLGSIYRFNLSSGYDHALILPTVNDTFNRAFCEFYIEGHANGAVLHKFPATGQLIQGQPKTEMVADRELVRLLSHAAGTYHWDVESTAGIDAFGEAVWSPQVITTTQTTPRPLDGNLTINLIRRFAPVNVGGSLWAKYTSSIKRKFRFQVVCDITLNGTPSSVITIAIRYFNAAAGTTTDIIVPGSSIPIAGNGTRNVFVLNKLLELNPNDRFQIVHYNNNNTNYTLTPQLTVD